MKIDINLDRTPVSKKFDSSLMEVYCIDFGDNYHKVSGEPTSEFEQEVRRLKGRYRDLSKFNQALHIYYEWMDYLAEKHGGKDIFKAKYKAGHINDYVPKKPRLKNIKSLKYLYKKGIVLSHQQGKHIISDEDELDRMVELYNDQLSNNNIIVDTVEDKTAEKIADTMYGKVHEHSASSFVSDVDYLQAYFMNKNKGNKKKGKKKKDNKKNKKKNKKQDALLITDVMNGYYDDVSDESDKAPLTTYNGLLLSSGTTKELDVYHKLSELGWDSYRIMKKAKYGKRVTSMFKVQKKKKKKKNKSSDYDDLIIDIMTDNNYSDFEEFQREMLDMTSGNIFK